MLTPLLALSTLAATPPDLTISKTSYTTGAITSGGSAQLNGHVYFAGGHVKSTSDVTNVVTDIDLQTGIVSALSSMPTARAGLGLVGFQLLSGSGGVALFAAGGIDGNKNVLGTVEMYSFTAGEWTALPSMNFPRAYLTLVAGTDNNIYAIGGVDSTGHSVSTVEAFNQATNSWSTVGSLNIPRSHFGGALGPDDTIYVVGGIDATGNILNSAEVYATATHGPWVNWLPMNQARSDFGLAVAGDGFLHVFGGRSSTGKLKSVEGYNFNTGVWTVEPETLPAPEAFLAAVEGLDGSDYLLGGQKATKFVTKTVAAVPPAAPSHSVVYFLHALDEPTVNGNFSMDGQFPLNGSGLQLSIFGSADWATFPAVTGTIESGGTATVTIPSTLGLGLINGATLYATNLDGGSKTQLGSVSSFLGLSGIINIPIATPLTLKNQVLVLNLSTLLGVNINLSQGRMFLQITGLNGVPTNP